MNHTIPTSLFVQGPPATRPEEPHQLKPPSHRTVVILLAATPGVIATEMFDRCAGDALRDQVTSIVPVGRVGASEEIAAAVLYLCSDAAKFTVGTSLVVDGAFIAQ
jgi:NAD(P)-dependent dehydrogenase (short-subunit alcohol dehydrogenase family)